LKYQKIIENDDTVKAGFICRSILLIEDIMEDAYCENIRVKIDLDEYKLIVEPVNCRYDVRESINVFSGQHDVSNVEIGYGVHDYNYLYEKLIDMYRLKLHQYVRSLVWKSMSTGVEYYMGLLFNGSAFIVEGEYGYVKLPRLNLCLATHTHPSKYAVPSSVDLESMMELFLDRGIGFIIVSSEESLAIYRVKPLSIDEFEYFKSIDLEDPVKALREIASSKLFKTILFK